MSPSTISSLHGTNHRIASQSTFESDGNIWLPYIRSEAVFLASELGEAALGHAGGHHDLLQHQIVLEPPLPHALLQLRPQPAVDQRLQLGRRHLGLRAGGRGGGWGHGGAAAAVGAAAVGWST